VGRRLNDSPSFYSHGFWYAEDRQPYIIWKELRAVRHAIESSPPQPKDRNVFLHEDNALVVATLSKLTTRSPDMMSKLRRL
jgi:hypothetical protein